MHVLIPLILSWSVGPCQVRFEQHRYFRACSEVRAHTLELQPCHEGKVKVREGHKLVHLLKNILKAGFIDPCYCGTLKVSRQIRGLECLSVHLCTKFVRVLLESCAHNPIQSNIFTCKFVFLVNQNIK